MNTLETKLNISQKQEELLKKLPNTDVTYWKGYYDNKLKNNSELCDNVRAIYEKKMEIIRMIEETTFEEEVEPEKVVLKEENTGTEPKEVTTTEETIKTEENTEKDTLSEPTDTNADNLPENQIENKEELLNPEVQIVTEGQPNHIIIEKIIENIVSNKEQTELKKEFPNQNIENKIEEEVVKELNNKNIKINIY